MRMNKSYGNGKWNLHHSDSKLSLTVWLEKKKIILTDDEKVTPFRLFLSLGFGLSRHKKWLIQGCLPW